MERESKNSPDLVAMGITSVQGKFKKLFAGTLMFVAPMLLLILGTGIVSILTNIIYFVIVGACVAFVGYGSLSIGYVRYCRKVFRGEDASLKDLFSGFNKFFPVYFFIGVLILAFYILSFCALIFPLIFAACLYSMIFFVMEDKEITTFRKAFKEAKATTKGNWVTMLSYKSLFYIFYLILFLMLAIDGIWLYKYMTADLTTMIIIVVLSVAFFILLYTIVTIYYHACNRVYYDEIVSTNVKRDERKATRTKKVLTETKVTEQPNTEKVESAPAEQPKAEKEAVKAPKKATTKVAPKKEANKKTTK